MVWKPLIWILSTFPLSKKSNLLVLVVHVLLIMFDHVFVFFLLVSSVFVGLSEVMLGFWGGRVLMFLIIPILKFLNISKVDIVKV